MSFARVKGSERNDVKTQTIFNERKWMNALSHLQWTRIDVNTLAREKNDEKKQQLPMIVILQND